jgi:S-adenosylmethionine/arginine decarboxylase-like enzyme
MKDKKLDLDLDFEEKVEQINRRLLEKVQILEDRIRKIDRFNYKDRGASGYPFK